MEFVIIGKESALCHIAPPVWALLPVSVELIIVKELGMEM
jgi:hypothetical protein